MNRLCSILVSVTALLGVVAACDSGPVGPSGRRWLVPSFNLVPSSSPADVSCAEQVAWKFNGTMDVSHFNGDSSQAAFFSPDDTTNPRDACGNLAFDEATWSPGVLKIDQLFTERSHETQAWTHRWRLAQSGTDSEVFDVTVPSDTFTPFVEHFQFDAPANDLYDFLGFFHRQADNDSLLQLPNAEVNAAAQLWRHIDPPDSLLVTSVVPLRLDVRWVNHHRNRDVDSTEVYRTSGGAPWERVREVAFNVDSIVDTVPASGHYWYAVRHLTSLFQWQVVTEDLPVLSQPNSAFTDSTEFVVDFYPPNGLRCEGNFDPTMDCYWLDSVPGPGASFELWRGDTAPTQLVATLADSVHSWTDTVTRGHTYVYAARRVLAAESTAFSPAATTTADPLPPENLSCGGTTSGRADCQWMNKETGANDTIEVQRRFGGDSCVGIWVKQFDTTQVNSFYQTGLKNGWTYCYRIRYRRGGDTTAFSDTSIAHPGQGEPYRPGGPEEALFSSSAPSPSLAVDDRRRGFVAPRILGR